MLLYRMLARTDRTTFTPEVVSLSADGPVSNMIRDLQIPVCSLGFTRSPTSTAGAFRIAAHFRRKKPAVVQTWMYHADLIGGMGARLAGIHPVVWGLHAAPDPSRESLQPVMRLGLRGAGLMSRSLPSKIVCCSYETRRVHEGFGYSRRKLVVIPNGFELEERI